MDGESCADQNHPLPNEITELQRQLLAREGLIATQALELTSHQRQIDHLKLQIARLRRFRFGQSSRQHRTNRLDLLI